MEQELLNGLYKRLEELIIKYGGSVENRQELPKRPLAYSIGKNREGIYRLFNIKIDPANIGQLDNELKLNESVIRVMYTHDKKGKSNG